MKRILKMILWSVLSLIALVLIVGFIFIKTSPQFGGEHNTLDIERYTESGHYKEGKFQNDEETSMDMNFSNIVGMLRELIKGNPKKSPKEDLPMVDLNPKDVGVADTNRFVWFGHSAFLLQLDGKNILIDPMLGESPSPHPLLGTSRYNDELPLGIDELPEIDLLLISHDHYDHLDYGSIQKLKSKVKEYYVPLGVGAHLKSWGVDSNTVHEMNWWDEAKVNDINLAFTPSRHFSGRGISDNSSTLWGSWIIKGEEQNIYFSGDGGYGKHFTDIGEKYGPFDLAFMECGQYNDRWAEIHMTPEETAQAGKDVKAKVMMPIHWGAFTLALHDWDDPVKRVLEKSKDLDLPVLVPKIGEKVELDSLHTNYEAWWKGLE